MHLAPGGRWSLTCRDRRRLSTGVERNVETGYAGTELGDWGFMPTDPMQLSAELHSRG